MQKDNSHRSGFVASDMAKYVLSRDQKRLPIDGHRTIEVDGAKPIVQTETIIFSEGKVVETDLDFGPWVDEGVLIRIRESGDPPRMPKPAPMENKPSMMIPLPVPAVVEKIKEVPPIERAPAVAESHLSTAPIPKPVENHVTADPMAPVEDFVPAYVEPEVPEIFSEDIQEAPKVEEPKVEEVAADPIKAEEPKVEESKPVFSRRKYQKKGR